ncbi:MAG TPA: pyridoxal-phosphate dependent enzyme [Planctomycetota bacterium]
MTLAPVFAHIDPETALRALAGVVQRTPLLPFPSGDPDIELRVKLECLQETGAFKARGAWNQIRQLDAGARRAGVVATSSGNHGKALAWAAARAGVPATIFMPADAYPNKIAACRDAGADVELLPTREAAETACAERIAAGAVLVHPYDSARTIEGAGTVGVEIAAEWPQVDVVVVPVGGGGLIAGVALALRRALGERVRVLGAEPTGARTLGRALAAGTPVLLENIDTAIQGLCPMSLGQANLEICVALGVRAHALPDAAILATQRALVVDGGWTVEPAGAAAVAAVLGGAVPFEWRARRPLRVAAIVSGGNPDPAQLAALRAGA